MLESCPVLITPLILIYENWTPEESVKVIGFLLLTMDPLGLEVNSNTTGVGIVHLDESDVIRNKLVKKIVHAYKNIENNS